MGKHKWIGVTFNCCRVYSRVYINKKGSAYQGRCPKCGRKVEVRIDPRGTDSRFFVAE